MSSRRFRRLANAIESTSLRENSPQKRLTRTLLVRAAQNHIPRLLMIFTLPGMEGYCAELFRATWPHARIVGVDRQVSVARLTKAHFCGRPTVRGKFENEIFYCTLRVYAEREIFYMWRFRANGEKERSWDFNFNFPPFDLLFLDMTARYDSPLDDVIQMINEHTASPAVVGVTLVLGNRKTVEVNINNEVAAFRGRLAKKTTLIGEPMNYFTNSSMLFFILLVD